MAIEEIIERVGKDIRNASRKITRQEARYLVDSYYTMQNQRIRLAGQLRAAEQGVDDPPMEVLDWFLKNAERLENQVKLALNHFSLSTKIGTWAQSVVGIGPVISAGLIAHIDMDKAKTPGHIYSYAGLVDGKRWLGKKVTREIMVDEAGINPDSTRRVSEEDAIKVANAIQEAGGIKAATALRLSLQKGGGVHTGKTLYRGLSMRPWNSELKTLCWKIGESFNMTCNNPKDLYGHLVVERKIIESRKNEAKEYAHIAREVLRRVPGHKQRAIYREGKLPNSQIHMRSKRWATKIFLSHWWEVAYRAHYGVEAPFQPYAFDHLKHVHKIEVPNWPW